MSCKSLNDALSYENDKLVKIFCIKRSIDIDESKFLFCELKRFLWFLAQRPYDACPFPILNNQKILDEYWHEFILYTESYMQFCFEYLGRYIHHYPYDTYDEFKKFVGKMDSEDEVEFIGIVKNSMLEVKKYLGNETVFMWYKFIPNKYFGGEE